MEEDKIIKDAQLIVLKAVSCLKTEEDVAALQQAITEFFAKRLDDQMERLWESGEWNQDKLDSFKTAHYRTPYK